MERLEKKVRDTEELCDLYIEDSFYLHDQLSKMQKQNEELKREVQALTYRDQQNMTKIQDLEKTNWQQTRAKEAELAAMQIQQQQERMELTRVHAENRELRTAMATRKPIPTSTLDSECGQQL